MVAKRARLMQLSHLHRRHRATAPMLLDGIFCNRAAAGFPAETVVCKARCNKPPNNKVWLLYRFLFRLFHWLFFLLTRLLPHTLASTRCFSSLLAMVL